VAPAEIVFGVAVMVMVATLETKFTTVVFEISAAEAITDAVPEVGVLVKVTLAVPPWVVAVPAERVPLLVVNSTSVPSST